MKFPICFNDETFIILLNAESFFGGALTRFEIHFPSNVFLTEAALFMLLYFIYIFNPFFQSIHHFPFKLHANKRIHFNDYIYWNRNFSSKLLAALPLHSNKVIYLKMPVVCARYAKCGTFGFRNVYYWIFCSPFSNHFSPWHSHDKGSKHKNFKHEIKKSS